MQLVLVNIIRFVVLILVQVFVLDNIQFLGYVTPMIYILFILSLPVRFHRGFLLILAFVMGLIIDMFSNTMGLHAFASVLIAFLRAPVIRMFVPLEEGANPSPSFRSINVNPYIKYVIALVLVYHSVLFMMESFSFFNLSLLVPKILISSTVTILLIFGIQSLKSK